MASRYITPPLSLDRYKGSLVRMKMEYVAALLRWAINWLNGIQDMAPEAAFEGLAHAKKVRRLASLIEDVFEEAAIAEMYHQDLREYDGDGFRAVLRPGRDRKMWRHDAVMTDLVDQTCERMAERFPYVPQKVLTAVVTEAMWQVHKVGRIEWRSTDLRHAGVDPDKHSRRTQERPTIDLRGPASYATTKKRPRGVHSPL